MPTLHRRGFLGALFSGAAALALDPEMALWVPRQKLISIPSAPILPPGYGEIVRQEVTAEILSILKNNYFLPRLEFEASKWDRRQMGDWNRMIGASLTIKKPWRLAHD